MSIYSPTSGLVALCEKEHAPLVQIIEELSAKAGIPRPRLLGVSPHAEGILTGIPAAAISAKELPHGGLLINIPLLKKIEPGFDFADAKTLQHEIRGLIAHEVGHLKLGDLKKPFGGTHMAMYAPWAGAAAAIAALGCIDLLGHAEGKKKLAAMSQEDASPKKGMTLMGVIGKTVQYLLTGGVGMVGGIYAGTLLRHRMEFRADKFSKELLGDGRPMADALRKTEAYATKLAQDMFTEHGFNEKQSAALNKITAFVERLTHPNVERRVAALGA